MTRRLALLLVLALGCAHRRSPSSDIKATPETRAVGAALETYRQAMESRNAQAVLALTTDDYFDDGGTPGPEDDVTRAGLTAQLEDLPKLESLKLRLSVRAIDVKGDRATAEVFFEAWYRVKTLAAVVPRHDGDVHRMTLRKVGGHWRFQSGL
jgi:ketosteroid isomerase-like protein